MVFQSRPSCILGVIGYFRSLSREKRSYNKLHDKGKSEDEDLGEIKDLSAFKENVPAKATYEGIVKSIATLSQQIWKESEEFVHLDPDQSINEENHHLCNHLYTKFRAVLWDEFKVKGPGIEWEKAHNSKFKEDEFAMEIIKELLSLAISDHNVMSGKKTEKEVKQEKIESDATLKSKQAAIPKRKHSSRPTTITVDQNDQSGEQQKPKQARKDNAAAFAAMSGFAEVMIADRVAKMKKAASDRRLEICNEIIALINDPKNYVQEESYHQAKLFLESIGVYAAENVEAMEEEDVKQIASYLKKVSGKTFTNKFKEIAEISASI